MAKVLLALPRHGQVEPESAVAAFLTASMKPDVNQVSCKLIQSSLLAFGFNQAMCEFMNDPIYEYFAMLHADVAPIELGWLDTMRQQLDDHMADLIHVPCAIKDDRGLTSTAIGTVWDRWRVRRITTTELHALPTTFDISDVLRTLGITDQNYCLLPNTGCMMFKRGDWCKQFPGFTISDEIVQVTETSWAPRNEPEDWALGRWMAKAKLRVIGTRAVTTNHLGRASYGTHEPWGKWSTDVHGNIG